MSSLNNSSHLSPNKSCVGRVGLKWSVFIQTILDLKLRDRSEIGLKYAQYFKTFVSRKQTICLWTNKLGPTRFMDLNTFFGPKMVEIKFTKMILGLNQVTYRMKWPFLRVKMAIYWKPNDNLSHCFQNDKTVVQRHMVYFLETNVLKY